MPGRVCPPRGSNNVDYLVTLTRVKRPDTADSYSSRSSAKVDERYDILISKSEGVGEVLTNRRNVDGLMVVDVASHRVDYAAEMAGLNIGACSSGGLGHRLTR